MQKPDSELIFLVEEAPEGGYTARALGQSIFTEADTLEDLHSNVREAVLCHFDDGQEPRIIRLHFVREEVIATWHRPLLNPLPLHHPTPPTFYDCGMSSAPIGLKVGPPKTL
jgi:hypothetical protein